MKKLLIYLLLGFILLGKPLNIKAVYESDEDGNSIEHELKEDEVRITDIMDEGEIAPDTPVSSDETERKPANDADNDEQSVYEGKDINLVVEDASNQENTLNDNKENSNYNWWSITISGLSGSLIGSVITYLILRRK
ncbi:MAG: hypothetical protein PHY26_01595 [Bacilli bacterium]|jgi:hypothetical protein|nr:hypothetical protein [Bacilli bacterium]